MSELSKQQDCLRSSGKLFQIARAETAKSLSMAVLVQWSFTHAVSRCQLTGYIVVFVLNFLHPIYIIIIDQYNLNISDGHTCISRPSDWSLAVRLSYWQLFIHVVDRTWRGSSHQWFISQHARGVAETVTSLAVQVRWVNLMDRSLR